MKKKVLYGVFMALFAFAAIGTLQSCKDDVSDLRQQTIYDVSNLKSQLSAAQNNLQQQITQNKADIAQLRQDLGAYATIAWVKGMIGDETQIEGNLVDMIKGALSRVKGLEDALGPVDGSNPQTVYGRLKALEEAAAYVTSIKEAFENNEEFEDMADLLAKTQQLLADFDQLANTDFPALVTRVDDLETAMDELTGRLDKQVTGILLQGTDNPLFGNFSLPIGIKSNMLFAWHGYNGNEAIEFPNIEAGLDATGNPIPEAVLSALNPEYKTIGEGTYYGIGPKDGEINLGKVYLTLNPTNVDFEGKEFTLETSDGKALPFLAEVKKSNERLAFGYTSRGSEDNGFYESDVVMPVENIKDCAITIEEGLKVAAKDALQDKSKRNAANLLKAIYDQMNGLLPAYALRCDWTYQQNKEDVPTAVLSQYDLAVATAKPLSFNFMKGAGTSHKLPTFGSFENFVNRLKKKAKDQFDFAPSEIKINGKTVSFQNVRGKKNIALAAAPGSTTGHMKVTVNGLTIDGNLVPEFDFVTTEVYSSLDFQTDVSNGISNKIYAVIYGLTSLTDPDYDAHVAEIKMKCDVYVLQIQQQIAEVVDEITGKAEKLINSAANKVLKYSDRVQQLFDLYNKVANKVNEVLANPNDYLQVAAFYTTSTNIDILSADPNQPTPFDTTTGDAICLYLSSYTGELIAPAYKKYAAITAIDGSTNDIADVNGGDLNKVLDGTQIRVNIPATNLNAGHVYEITYQAVDFNGWTSTRRFYIQVI